MRTRLHGPSLRWTIVTIAAVLALAVALPSAGADPQAADPPAAAPTGPPEPASDAVPVPVPATAGTADDPIDATTVPTPDAPGPSVLPGEVAAAAVTVDPLQIAARSHHTCALTPRRGVACWGDNNFGQVGNGNPYATQVPWSVIGLGSGVSQVTAGSDHSCALTDLGAVRCWGTGIGIGAPAGSYEPIDVPALTSGVSSIAAAHEATCVIVTGDEVRCWGFNYFGQLGDGTTTDHAVPTTVAGLSSGVTSVAGGFFQFCAVTTGGGVRCWGYNGTGQLGDGTTTDRPTPVPVAGLAGPVATVAPGWGHTCALTTAGGVQCWGANGAGQLGDGTTTDRSAPVDVIGLTTGVAGLYVGIDHSCAVKADQSAWCWGANEHGQIGDGTTTSRSTPTAVIGLDAGVAQLAAADDHTCALLVTGTIECWGTNGAGELGDRTNTDRPTPAPVAPIVDLPGCPPLAANPNTTVDLSADNEEGSVATFAAAPGYTLVGTATLTCRSDLTWSGEPPTASPLPGGIQGVVRGGSTGLAGIDVRLYDTEGTTLATTRTAADGSYAFVRLSPGTVKVRFGDPRGVWRFQWFDGATSFATATPVVITDAVVTGIDDDLVPSTTRVSGRVTAAANPGAPVAGIDVRVEDLATGVLAAKTKTDAQGRYLVADLVPGSYRVRFSDATGFWRWQWFAGSTTAAGATPVLVENGSPVVADAALDPAAAVTGRVTGTGNWPLPGIDVRVYDASTGALRGKAVTGADGRYFVPNLDLAPYGRAAVRVRFSDPTGTYAMRWHGRDPLTSDPFVLRQPGPLTLPEQNLRRSDELRVLRGTVTDGSVGLAGISVRVYPAAGGSRIAKVRTTASGDYEVADLAEGAYVVQFGDEDGAWAVQWYADSPVRSGAVEVIPPADGSQSFDVVLHPAVHHSFLVDSPVDTRDAAAGDGTCDDGDGRCTMRAAVDEANANLSSDTITIATGVNPTLTIVGPAEDLNATGDLDIRNSLTIHGGGATIDANDLDRAVQGTHGLVTIDHLTLTNGTTAGDRVAGGDDGGAILVTGGDLVMTDCSVTDSEAVRFQAGAGGGIAARGALTLIDCVITGNRAESSGGGVFAGGPSTTILRTTISDNSSFVAVPDIHGDESSAALNIGSLEGVAGPVRIEDSTISGNASLLNDQARSGGGMNIYATTAVIRNSTIAGNSANLIPGRIGGCCGSAGFAGTGGPMQLIDVTIADNTGWPGVYQVLPADGVGPFTMTGAIIAGAYPVCNGAFTSLGFNVWTDASCGAGLPSDHLVADPELGPLASNGGPTRTRLPSATSPAVDAVPIGTSRLCDSTIPTDQRGVTRPRGVGCDIGAVER